MITTFNVGSFYSSEEIYKSLRVGNAGGVRISVDEHSVVKRMVVMTSAPSARTVKENPYHDRIEGNTLVYVGAGKEGDQQLSGLNRRFAQQRSDLFPIYGFMIVASRRDKKHGPKRWLFLGMLEHLRHYQDMQIDARGCLRKAWVFEFRIHREPQTISVEDEQTISVTILNSESGLDRSSEDDRQVTITEGLKESEPAKSFLELEQTRSRLLSLDPNDFEFVIRDVLERTNFENVTVTRYSQDGGIDLNAYPSGQLWPIGGMLVQLQAKRWLHTVGRKEVAELRGSLDPFARGVVVTTSHFSRAAISEATSSGKNPIVLVDGIRFASIINSLEGFVIGDF
jgi:hypothetical protein